MYPQIHANSRSRRAGKYYENRVAKHLCEIQGCTLSREVYLAGGYVDILITSPRTILVECKTVFVPQAISQLARYAQVYPDAPRVCICKRYEAYDLPAAVAIKSIDSILSAAPRAYTIIPWTGKYD